MIIERTFSIVSETLPTNAEMLKYHRLPNDLDIDERIDLRNLRWDYIKYSFTVLTHEFITAVAKLTRDYKMVMEVSCGLGWMSHWIIKYGGKVNLSIDNMSSHFHEGHLPLVTKGDAIYYVRTFKPDLVIMGWPNYDEPFAKEIWDVVPNALLYIGEGYGGCTGDDAFHDAIEEHEVRCNIPYINFDGLHDYPQLLVKNG